MIGLIFLILIIFTVYGIVSYKKILARKLVILFITYFNKRCFTTIEGGIEYSLDIKEINRTLNHLYDSLNGDQKIIYNKIFPRKINLSIIYTFWFIKFKNIHKIYHKYLSNFNNNLYQDYEVKTFVHNKLTSLDTINKVTILYIGDKVNYDKIEIKYRSKYYSYDVYINNVYFTCFEKISSIANYIDGKYVTTTYGNFVYIKFMNDFLTCYPDE